MHSCYGCIHRRARNLDNDPIFKDAKAWSDFIGFHVRMSFLMAIAWVALMPAVVEFMISFDRKLPYSPLNFVVEIVVFLGAMALALVMLRKISRVVAVYLRRAISATAIANILTAAVLVVEVFLALVLMRLSYLQILRIYNVSASEADRIGRAMVEPFFR